ncbi:hypothetical protein [Parabacteroides sp. AM08-6]|uniref:hypothetical protein n=1 Tax=Parabacteroides sp. AM08-6 TaxID=2292053 RepID=UPI000EFE67B8|nr:hypothetical protein [Parabacteroides sp. AM08-6]RHJ75758.1 hypothetical protein DW103_17355 [Parabacteroides sp. AM08-6]
MKKLTIPMSGINRSTDDAIAIDGQCMELINARLKNGSIEPVGHPILEKTFTSGLRPVYIHKNGIYEHVITYSQEGDLIYDSNRTDNGYISKNIIIHNIPNIREVQSVGNTLVVTTVSATHYILFSGTVYKYLGEKPEMPVINFFLSNEGLEKSENNVTLVDRIKVELSSYNQFENGNIDVVTNAMNGSVSKLVSKVNKDGYLCYPIFVRYALKLYDGSHIMHSAPLLLMTPYMNPVSTYIYQNLTNSDDSWINWKDGYMTGFKFESIVSKCRLSYEAFTTELTNWKDIITSIDIFISKPINTVNLNSPIEDFYCGDQGSPASHDPYLDINLNTYNQGEIKDKALNVSVFYKVHSIDIKPYVGATKIQDEKVLENLEQNETLSDDPFSHNRLTGGSFIYNSKLHLYNIQESLYEGYPLDIFQIKSQYWGETPAAINGSGTTHVYIKTDSGEKITSSSFRLHNSYGLIPFICYPDSRATKIIIRITASGKTYQKTFMLTSHPFLNLAYNIHDNYVHALTLDDFSDAVTAKDSEDALVKRPNILKVSEVNNPFIFPSDHTYSVSNREIIGLAVVTNALSTGQFGQFPLYVFTGEGIYALSTGIGDIAYQNAFPVTRDCCNNPQSIVSTDNSVVFSTERGLMILSGSTVATISDKIEGFLPSSIDSSPIIKKIATVAGLENTLSSIEFIYYLKDACIGYNYEDKEVIVSNTTYGYSYVYGLTSGEWHKISIAISGFLNSYPQCFAVLSDHGMYNMYNQHRTVNKILLLTRPIKFGSITYKRILQSAIRGVIRPSQSNLYFRGESVKFRDQEISIFSNCGVYVLGSNDAEHFTLISGREKIEDVRDLITKMNKTHAFKYFMFCVAGGVRTDVSLNYIEVLADETYQNRLR